jgi:hypothetical protein
VFKIVSALSLLLCAGSIAVWALSHWALESLNKGITDRWEICCYSGCDRLTLAIARWTGGHADPRLRCDCDWGDSLGLNVDWGLSEPLRAETGDHWCGCRRNVFIDGLYAGIPPTADCWFVSPRYWQLALLFAILPTWSVVRFLRRRGRIDPSVCPACNYNLTGNASGVCPECGNKITETQRA